MADSEMTDPQKGTEPDYKIERPKPKMTRQQKLGMGALLAGASLAALWTSGLQPRHPRCGNLRREEFQDQVGGSPFGAIESGRNRSLQEMAFPTSKGNWLTARDLEARNATLQSEVERLQRELGDLADRADAEKDQTAKELALALEEAQSQNLLSWKTCAAVRSGDRRPEGKCGHRWCRGSRGGSRMAAKRAEREAQLAARVASPSVVFDEWSKGWDRGCRMGMPGALPRVEMLRGGISCSRDGKPPPPK